MRKTPSFHTLAGRREALQRKKGKKVKKKQATGLAASSMHPQSNYSTKTPTFLFILYLLFSWLNVLEC